MNHSTEELDDAAVWIARLRAPDRSVNVERGFRRWLGEKPSHAAAYETITTAWELTAALKSRPLPALTPRRQTGWRVTVLRAAAATAALAAVVIAVTLLHPRFNAISTGVGEQRVLTLEDGTRVFLNTASRVAVRYGTNERRVELQSGEALFEVARQPGRPFVVEAGNRRIEALGTTFLVREDAQKLFVTLMEGKVAVSSDQQQSVILAPGQRLTLTRDSQPRLDAPALSQMDAWRRGQIEFDDTPLLEAAAEMNRYSALKLTIDSEAAATLHINGIFRTGDTTGLAAAIQRAYGLRAEPRERQIVLTGTPSPHVLSEDTAP